MAVIDFRINKSYRLNWIFFFALKWILNNGWNKRFIIWVILRYGKGSRMKFYLTLIIPGPGASYQLRGYRFVNIVHQWVMSLEIRPLAALTPPPIQKCATHQSILCIPACLPWHYTVQGAFGSSTWNLQNKRDSCVSLWRRSFGAGSRDNAGQPCLQPCEL